jgi:hypothetical protein
MEAPMPQAPKTVVQLANTEPDTRGDLIAFCAGVDNLCGQISLIILGFSDDLYRRLATSGGGGYTARAKARNAIRPFRALASAVSGCGRLANRCYRHYAKLYAEEIQPAKQRTKFDHTK